ncbi:MAG: 23S rRNA (guanosine(2251)-2'-O)-methyltransferase RlmB, partial [Selenomonadaceae bacterium]|nr:23S rRNA (guanosine(2251)-2'-O)-methyltransferase RlmB [Selenomonadaceae bacterium]
EALESGREINRVLILKSGRGFEKILDLIRDRKIPFDFVAKDRLDRLAPGKNQGIAAMVSPVEFVDLDEILDLAKSQNETPFVLILDELEDPHNLGALIRTADAAGIHGVIIPRRHSAPISSAVAKSSAGAIEHVKIARVGNIRDTLEELKNLGLWIIGADLDSDKFFYDVDLKIPIGIVVGNEGRGLRRLTREACDILVKIPMLGKIQSLNASVAGALLMYESIRQKRDSR